jgi:phosphoserine phosphatase
VGNDRPGIIASVAETLGKYRINIEFAQSIGRQGVFLTELLTDISHSTLPLENIKNTLRRTMAEVNIQTLFQTEDVFNKEKRMIVFDIGTSFIAPELRAEILEQTNLTAGDIASAYSLNHVTESLKKATALLEGFPAEVLHGIIERIQPTPGTLELLQTLRIMGYRIVLVTTGFDVFTEAVGAKLGIDHVFGYPLPIDDDSRTVVGEIPPAGFGERDLHKLIAGVASAEGIGADNVSIVSDEGHDRTPGIRLEFDLEQILEYHNDKILSRDALLGLLGSFGVPRA